MAHTIELVSARQLAFRFVLAQVAVTLLVAAASLVLAGTQAASSALLGGGISVAGSLAMALIAFRHGTGSSAPSMLMALLFGEATKLFVVVAMFVVVLTLVKVSPAPMFTAYVGTFLVYWLVFVGRRRESSTSGQEMR
jgi:ATP synthase protein I